MAIAGISGAGGVNLSQLAELYRQQVSGTGGAGDAGAAEAVNPTAAVRAAEQRSSDFGNLVADGLGKVESLDQTAQSKAIQAATGDLTDVHDYVIAATEAQTATELTTTMRNKALEAFNEIMRMPL
jgi:flagellar hook-basal body complex protein FliE